MEGVHGRITPEAGLRAGITSQAGLSGQLYLTMPGEPGKTPVRGVDYWTESDKAEIVRAVLEALPDAGEVRY